MARALSDFHDDVQFALGNKGLGDTLMTRFINDAYLDVCGAVDIEDIIETGADTTADGTEAYSVPSGAIVVKNVVDTSNNYLLEFQPKSMFLGERDGTASARSKPKAWTRVDDELWLSPIPDDAYGLLILFKEVPTLLVDDTDELAIPEIWEPAVYMLAVHYGMMAQGDENRAMMWLQRAATYVQTRISDGDYYANSLSLSLTQARFAVEE